MQLQDIPTNAGNIPAQRPLLSLLSQEQTARKPPEHSHALQRQLGATLIALASVSSM